jgi:hypothetical protein
VRARYLAYAHESFGDFLWQIFGEGSLAHSLYGPQADVSIPEAAS